MEEKENIAKARPETLSADQIITYALQILRQMKGLLHRRTFHCEMQFLCAAFQHITFKVYQETYKARI